MTRVFAAMVLPAVCAAVTAYFGYYAIWGERGVLALESVQADLGVRQEQLAQIRAERLRLGAVCIRVSGEAEAVESSDVLVLDKDVAAFGDLGFQHRVLFQPAHQDARPPIDEAGGQSLVQSVRQSIL